MSHNNVLWPNLWSITMITIFFCTAINSAKQITTNETPDQISQWIDEKGLLRFHRDDRATEECHLCPQIDEWHTEGSEVCYTADSPAESVCGWSRTMSDDSISLQKVFNIPGLKVLSLTKYKIQRLMNIDKTFAGLTDLECLFLESNHITSLSTSGPSKEPLHNLKVLSLAYNPISSLSEDSFSWLEGSNLEILNLRGCSSIKILDSHVFTPLASSTSLWLDLSYTILDAEQLSNLTSGFKKKGSEKTEGLKVLSLAHTGLYTIPKRALDNVKHSLEKLSLQGNYFNNCRRSTQYDSVEDCNFPILSNLKEINLKDCGLTNYPFEWNLSAAENLNILYLDENPLEGLSSEGELSVSYISLKNIQRDKGFLLCANGSKCSFPKLRNLDLSNTRLNVTFSNFSTLPNLQYLSLRNSITDNMQNLLKPLNNLKSLDLSYNNFSNNFDLEYFKGLSNLKVLKLQSSSIRLNSSSSPFVHLTSLKVLDMRNNYIRSVNTNLFQGLQKLQTLILMENRIGSWESSFFNDTMPSLITLNLQSNWISDITSAMETDFQNILEVDLSYNPLSCEKSCRLLEIHKNQGSCGNNNLTFVLLNCNDPVAYICTGENNIQIPLFKEGDMICKTDTTTIKDSSATTTTTSFSPSNLDSESTTPPDEGNDEEEGGSDLAYFFIIIAILPIVGALSYWKRWHIIMCVRIFRRNMMLSLLKDNNTKLGKKESYQYDVFLSYSDRDREWILQQLIPNIEQRGHIKVCLHERDFEAGLPVLENIMACMDHSRCVLLVLSEAFLRSHWCQFELNLAQHRLLEMQHDRLILVLLENIPRDKCSKMLRYLMLTKTYVVWPANDSDEEKCLFWRKLKKAIGPVHDSVNVSFA